MKQALFCLILLMLTLCSSASKAHAQKLTIGFVSVGEVTDEHFQIAEDAILDFYQAKVKLSSYNIAYDTGMVARKTWGDEKIEMTQLDAKAVNAKLSELKNKKYDLIIGLTDSALTIGKRYTGKMIIRGLADRDKHVATVSTYKLKQESANEQEFRKNLTKVVRHEVAHVLGLSHCEDSEQCLMLNGFKFEDTIPEFCPVCLEKIDKRYLKQKDLH
ncbi:MAG: matrixin family metalloprotease [Cyclobacteriaceae bacterium]